MSATTYGRSPVEIAEDRVIAMCMPVFNMSPADATSIGIQREEIAGPIRSKAVELLEPWAGSPQQCAEAGALYLPWEFLTRAFRRSA